MPVILHNLKGYDSHLIMKALQQKFGPVNVVPNNMEKYMSLSVGQTRFIDSMQFMSSSLADLANNLDPEEMNHTHRQFPEPMKFEEVRKKGVYPYDYFSSFDRFSETELPNQSAFHSKLTDEGISNEEFERAKRVWQLFDCQTLKDYHDIYLKTDICLLADVFEKFRMMCLSTYKLDPVHYFSAPGLAFDAALKMTKVNLELFTDINMHLFTEKAIRGGVSMITHRMATANNHYLPDGVNPEKELQHLIYLDANNLYGWAMSQPLPTHGHRWLSDKEIESKFSVTDFQKTLDKVHADNSTGYI